MNDDRLRGKIVHYSPEKKFGFIRLDGEADNDIFFHLVEFKGMTPHIGDRASFYAEADPRRDGRRRAKDVIPL